MRGKCGAHRSHAKAAKVRPFNEARALCAGNVAAESEATRGPTVEPFNEARALCAGNGPRYNPRHTRLLSQHCERS